MSAIILLHLGGVLGAQAHLAVAAAGDQLDHLVGRHIGTSYLGHHRAEVEHGDVVGHLEDVVEVVADQDHAEPVVGQPPHQPQHLLGLGDAQGGRGLVEDDELGVPQHRAGDRDGLPLAAGQRRDGLPHRLQRAHREAVEGLAGAGLHGVLVERRDAAHLAAQEHVVDHVEVVAEREVLVDDLDARARSRPCGPCTVTGWPSKRYSPSSKAWMPAMPLIRVLLPAPLSPTSAVTWPARTSRSTPRSTWTAPKLFWMLRRLSSGVVASAPGEGARASAVMGVLSVGAGSRTCKRYGGPAGRESRPDRRG